jgi:hypothetical protein
MKIFGQHDEPTIAQFQRVREGAVDAALMPDSESASELARARRISWCIHD